MMKNSSYAVSFPAARRGIFTVGALPQPGSRSVDASRRSGPRLGRNQGAQAHQIVDRLGEGEHPAHGLPPAMSELAHEANHLVPAEDLLHPFALPLTDGVAGMPRRPSVDRTVLAPRMHIGTDVGGDV